MTNKETILHAVESTFGVSRKELLGHRNTANVAAARLTAGYFLLTEANLSLDATAKVMRRSRPWSSWARYKAMDRGEVDNEYAKRVNAVYVAIKGVAA